MPHTWKVGDRVILPACNDAAGTVTFVNRITGYTDVRYDDGEQAACFASDLVPEEDQNADV